MSLLDKEIKINGDEWKEENREIEESNEYYEKCDDDEDTELDSNETKENMKSMHISENLVNNELYPTNIEHSHIQSEKNIEGFVVSLDDCTKADKLRILDLYAAEIIRHRAIGYEVYIENIFNCRVSHDGVDVYIAEFRLNDFVCEFHVINDTTHATLTFMPTSDEYKHNCKDFKGLQ